MVSQSLPVPALTHASQVTPAPHPSLRLIRQVMLAVILFVAVLVALAGRSFAEAPAGPPPAHGIAVLPVSHAAPGTAPVLR
jgi:hypothetical protein